MKYPIYIPSKGRADNQKTSRLLTANKIPHILVVEKKEMHYYLKLNSSEFVQIIPLAKSDYGTSSVARNFCIDHSKSNGFKRHWQLDDDISAIYEHAQGRKLNTPLTTIFSQLEKVNDMVPHVHMLGTKNSGAFLSQSTKPYEMNTSLTSLYLITNTQIRFRLRMLVDIDYALQVLQSGAYTMRYDNYAFTFQTPGKFKGGYYDTYKDDKVRMECLKEFLDLHPEVKPGIKRSSTGHYVLANIGKVWNQYKIKTK